MRRPERSAPPTLARALFERAPYATLAYTDTDGTPVLRALHVVVVPEGGADAGSWWLGFHGAPVGEKVGCVGRRAVLAVAEPVAQIPSTFTDPERACPATTWYRAAQVRGTLEAVDGSDARAALLNTLMTRFQPEGGHRPIDAADPMYAAAVRSLLLVRLRADEVTAKVSVGQDKPPEVRERVLRALWARGQPGDAAAVSAALAFPPEPWPSWLGAPGGVTLHPQPGAEAFAGVLPLLRSAEWNAGVSDAALRRAHLGSAWIAARAGDRWVATARAATDGGKFAWLADVYVDPAWRGQGVGRALVERLLDHPDVRSCARVLLRTRDAERLYAGLGFRTFAVTEGRPWMGLARAAGP